MGVVEHADNITARARKNRPVFIASAFSGKYRAREAQPALAVPAGHAMNPP